MNKAILLCASIGWQTINDEEDGPKSRHIVVSVSWMPYVISYKRCKFNYHISGEFTNLTQREPQLIEMMVDRIARYFARASAKLMEQNMSEVSDLTDACDELRRGLPDGFRAFLENGNVWIHHFNQVQVVPKGSRYRAEDGEWYEAEENMIIVVHCGAASQMMTQEEFTKIQGYDTERA